MFQPSVPGKYVRLSDDELAQRIAACIILGHRSASITEVYAEKDEQQAMEAMMKVS